MTLNGLSVMELLENDICLVPADLTRSTPSEDKLQTHHSSSAQHDPFATIIASAPALIVSSATVIVNDNV